MQKHIQNNRGLTLVEILASLILITLILLSFLMMFTQAAKTNKTSENIIDGTYLAQVEMERIIATSKIKLTGTREQAIKDLGYSVLSDQNSWFEFTKNVPDSTAVIKVKLEKKSGDVTRIIIEVFSKSGGPSRAKMENALLWEATA